jgi:phage tail-like protein
MAQQQLLSTYLYVLSIPEIDTIGYFNRVSGLEVSFDVYEYREGGNNDFVHRLPGTLHYPNLTLERGLTNEAALLTWFWATQKEAQRKEITLTIKGGASARKFTFADAFPVRWTGPQADATGAAIATETLEIAHGGIRPA